VIDAVASKAPPGANIMIGGQSLQDMIAKGGGSADPTEQLAKLADLHDRGAWTTRSSPPRRRRSSAKP